MAATREMIREWCIQGIKEKKTHLIVAYDSFDYTDYPVYVSVGQDPRKVARESEGIMEVYNLHMDIEPQLKAGRSFNY